MKLITFPYNRRLAVEYAHRWAYGRNPEYFDYQGIGGDCTSFASQCIYAGAGIMNYTPVYGWYYITANARTASWTGVQYLYNFLTANQDTGPFAAETDLSAVEPGDVCQLALDRNEFHHTPVIVSVGEVPSLDNILVAAHSRDVDDRPLSTYNFRAVRFLHIEGVRTRVPDDA